jgi:hypothetical protein
MGLSTGYLTPKQRLIWGLKTSGLKEANIARKLNITRQTVHRTIDIANTRVCEALKEVAELNRIKIQALSAEKGFLSGYSPHFKTQAFVTFSAKNGVQVWYNHESQCNDCQRLKACREMLIAEATERNFLITEDIDKIVPSKLADALFSRIAKKTD